MPSSNQLTVGAEWQPFINSGQGSPQAVQNQRTGNGYGQWNPTTAVQLTTTPALGVAMPAEARHAWIIVKDNPIRIRTDGVDPTALSGLYIPAGTMFQIENQRQFLEQLRFINTAAGPAEVSAMFFV